MNAYYSSSLLRTADHFLLPCISITALPTIFSEWWRLYRERAKARTQARVSVNGVKPLILGAQRQQRHDKYAKMDREFMEQLWSERHYGTPLAIIFMVLPTIAVGLRLYAKITANQQLELSDYLSIAAWANTAGLFISLLVAVYLPASFLDNPDGIDEPVSKITFSLNLLWAGACYCCKLSILCLYYRLLSTPSSTFRLLVQAMFILTACIGIASCLGFLLIFRDMSWWWTTGLRSHPVQLAQMIKMNEAIDILSLLTDVILFAMPLPVIAKLSLDKQKKRLLIGLFSLGFL